MYGDNEDLLGKWFTTNPEKRKNIFLATKFGIKVGPGGVQIDSSPEYCRSSIEKSLSRLGVSYVDLYYIHHLDRVTPIEKTMEVMSALVKEGKIRYIGLSDAGANTLRRACAIHQVACCQTEYNPFTRDLEDPQRAFRSTARELGVAIVAYSPLARGLLSGAIRSVADVSGQGDMRGKMLPRYMPENLATNVAVDEIRRIAERKGVTTAQLTLAWVLAQGDDIFAISGTTKVERLKENLGAMAVELTAEEEMAIRNAGGGAVGARIPPNYPGVNLFGDTPPLRE